tara:strand:- start:57614 stop:58204 length:591 start_codon:yes stop_codon:yes gene_type:complete
MEKLLNDFGDHVSRSLADIHDVPQAGFLAAKQMANVLQRTPMHLRSVRRENPLSDELEAALGLACQLDEPVSKFVPSFSKFADQLPWYRRAARGDVVFEHGYINAEVIGPKGIVFSDEITVGVTLMRPDIVYPDHHHPPEEVYIVLSPGFWRQKDEEWWAPGPGGYVYNVPDILHAMKSDADPLFAIWCLNLSPEI